MTELLVQFFLKDNRDPKDPAVYARYGKLAGWVGIVCNLLLAGVKLLSGILSGSIAVTADAVNNLSDAASSVITLAGFKLASKPADKEHPFGHARFEYIAGLAVAVMILVIGVELAKSSVQKIMEPTPVEFGWLSLLILLLAIIIKVWMAFFNRSIGRRIGSSTLEATSIDSRNDAITTTALLVAALIARFTGLKLDGWMGLAVAVFILVSGIGIVKDTLNPLIGEAPDPELVRQVAEKIKAYPGVLGTHDLIVHDYGPGRRFASAHVEMDSRSDVLKSHDIIDNIERDFLQNDNIHLIIHYDPIVVGNGEVDSTRNWVLQQVKKLDERFSIHDFRMLEGPSHINYIFDVVVPQEYEMSDEELEKNIQAAVQHGKKPVYVVLTIDRSYAPIPS